ncbi:small oligopeptide transporter, OPT family protein [Ophiocordyceps sinensis CO18]|uniref:Small oligopeptide transporter, OPT family protein n=1 Tax=Ophiocordyceps sinensis (strain Co18 / CGMCC 3.14243) TaxID=911162 RepID=T5AF95_OPHSC|nr:small oligopeptide transporter, OPT family protein [Ophiocordyceps sinensis CO18]
MTPDDDAMRVPGARADLDAALGKTDVVDWAVEHHDADEDSPYQEVRAAVRNSDGGEVANTLRAWIIGLFFGSNRSHSIRSPVISLPAIVVQLLAYPIGCLWARVVPKRVFTTLGTTWTLNTGPFTIKEHVVVTLMSNVSIGGAYSTDALVALQAKPFYNVNLGWGFAVLFTLSSQLIGIALTGLFRRFLVWPAAMVWPRQFASTALFYALHDRTRSDGVHSDGWRVSRYRWFLAVAAAMFCYSWVPAVLWRGLSVFAFVTWIRPRSRVLNQLFGGYTGLSLLPITFDWTYVTAYLGDPLLAPTHSHVNTLVGVLLFVVVTTVGIVYSGALYADYLPMVTAQTYDNTQRYYNTSRILGPGMTFDEQKYAQYSPLFLPPALALNYGLSFAALTSAMVHIWLFHGNEVWYRFRTARNQKPDVHMKMMRKYPDAPNAWYVGLLLLSVALGLGTALGYDSQLPWWAFLVSILLALIFIIPVTMVLAVSNILLGLNILSPFLAGFLIPGRPIGVMVFNVYSTVVLLQAQTYSGDLKLAHYMKVPPKTTFWCQVVATAWAVFVQIAVMNWTLGHVGGDAEDTGCHVGGDAEDTGCHVGGDAEDTGCHVGGDAEDTGCHVGGDAEDTGCHVGGDAEDTGCHVGGDAEDTGCHVGGDAEDTGCHVGGDAEDTGCHVGGDAEDTGCHVGGDAEDTGCHVGGDAEDTGCHVGGDAEDTGCRECGRV